MEKEARFILKADKYSLLIIHLIDSNKKTKKGISIYNKTLEMNELNEDNINMVLNKKDKIVYSFANIGLIDIAGLKCFMYCSEKDVKEVGIISYTKIYQILNISYFVLEDMDTNTTSEIISFFKEHSKMEVSKGLFFAQDVYNMDKSFDVSFYRLYERNKNVCHISPDINFCYNYDNISFFEKFGFKEFTTHVISGYFNQSKINVMKKEEFINNLIIKDKEIHDDKFTKNNDIKEIEIIFYSNKNIFLNPIYHIIFYVFSGIYLDAKIVLNDILKKNQSPKRTDNGAIIMIDLDNLVDKNEDKKPDIINNEIEEELNQIIGNNNKLIIIHKKKETPKIIKSDKIKNYFSEMKYNYEFKGEEPILEFQEKQLLIISDSQEHFISIIENILDFIQYPFSDKQAGLKYQIKINVKSMLNSYKEFQKSSNYLKAAKLKVEVINEKYLKGKSINIFKQGNKKNLELKEKQNESENNNNIIFNEDNIKDENKKENEEIIINENSDSEGNKLLQNIDEKNKNKYLYIVTYNTANYTFENTEEEKSALSELLFPKKIKDIFRNEDIPTFLVIGLQEIVKLNTSNVIFDANKSSSYLWETKITEKILQDYNYTLQYRENMVGVLFLIFVKSSELKNIKNMKKSIIKAGFMKALGNKGYIIYEFKYKDKTFSFGTGHLTAGENDKNYKERTNLLIDFLNHKCDKNSNKLHESDFYFLFGDMNFRVKSDKKGFLDIYERVKDINLKNKINDDSVIGKTKLLCNYARKLDIGLKSENKRIRNIKSVKKRYIYKYKYFKNFLEINNTDEDNINFSAKRKLDEPRYKYFFSKKHLENDELNGFKNSLTNYNIAEKEINFLPTYKYIKRYNYYDISKRTPAWTDRILFKKSDNIKCIQYDKINIKISDHRPVFGLFEIKI